MLRYFSKNSTTQENITISRQNLLFFNQKHKKQPLFSNSLMGNTKSSLKENARTFSKNSTTQENINILRLKEDSKTYSKKETSNQN